MPDQIPDYYELLMILRDASAKEVNEAYRHAMKYWYPDLLRDRPERYRDLANRNAILLGQAKELLLDPVRRVLYDQLLDEYHDQLEERARIEENPASRAATQRDQAQGKRARRHPGSRVKCPVCLRETAGRKDGLIRLHFDGNGKQCGGSLRPRESSPAKEPPLPNRAFEDFRAGELVWHPTYGNGTVVRFSTSIGYPTTTDVEVMVAFKGGAGLKKIFLSRDTLERIHEAG